LPRTARGPPPCRSGIAGTTGVAIIPPLTELPSSCRAAYVSASGGGLKTVFITGATGFVGSHTAALFLKRGWRVRALVRRPNRLGLLPAGVEAVPGDLADANPWRGSLAGCDAVLHVAGLVKARKLKEYLAVNADGAECVAAAAAAVCPAAMFVLVSSQAAAGPALEGRPLTESSLPNPVSWYGKSKLEGERRVERLVRGPWCVIRPSVVYGPGDPGVLELFKTIQTGFAPVVAGGRTRVQLLAVADLARVLVGACAAPALSGRRMFAAGDTVSMRELVTYIAALRRPPARRVPVPAFAVRLAGLWESLRETVTRTARPFNRDKAREMLQPDWLCDPDPLLRDLGLSDLTPWRQGIRDLCRCYVTATWLRPSVWEV
jgi:dihydroflavonol-4-reductase